jgi:cyclomaltodextrinase
MPGTDQWPLSGGTFIAMGLGHIVYGVIVKSFSADGLLGVEKRIPYLTSLGITTIWLSPIFEHPRGDFGYAMTDYRRIDPEHGSKADLLHLVETAHRDGLRILLDLAPNHTSDQHRFYRDVTTNGADSGYADYYDRDAGGAYTHYFHWANLINLNYDNRAVQRMVTDAMTYWVTECDIDGYRMDAAWGIRQRSPAFWAECLHTLRGVKPDLFLLAEASALDPFYGRAGFDSAYDWTHHLGTWAWGHAFSRSTNRATDLRYHVEKSTGRGDVFRFLNNNDTGPRFVTSHGPAVNKLATAVLLTLPGTPCLFMGDEVGLEFTPYRQPGPVTWPVNRDLLQFHRRLIALRKQHQLGHGSLVLVDNDRPDDCLSYSQPGHSELPVVSLFNLGPATRVSVDVGTGTTGALDLWHERRYAAEDGKISVDLASNAFSILQLELGSDRIGRRALPCASLRRPGRHPASVVADAQ